MPDIARHAGRISLRPAWIESCLAFSSIRKLFGLSSDQSFTDWINFFAYNQTTKIFFRKQYSNQHRFHLLSKVLQSLTNTFQWTLFHKILRLNYNLLHRFWIYLTVSTSRKKQLLDIHATSNIKIKSTLHHNSFLNLLYVIALLILNVIQVIFFF